MAQLWPDEISEDTIGRGLKRIGFTQKKTYAYRERDRKKRQAFLAELETIQPEQRVFSMRPALMILRTMAMVGVSEESDFTLSDVGRERQRHQCVLPGVSTHW